MGIDEKRAGRGHDFITVIWDPKRLKMWDVSQAIGGKSIINGLLT